MSKFEYDHKVANQPFEKERFSNDEHSRAIHIESLEQEASDGNIDACVKLGRMYRFGEGVDRNLTKAVYWYGKAAEKGNVDALNSLTELANIECIDAQFQLGDMYNHGKGVNKDLTKATYWYRIAAEKGISDASYRLGIMYCEGDGVKKNLKTALKWFYKAGRDGFGLAKVHIIIGDMYYNGDNVEKNLKEAIRHYRKALAQENNDEETVGEAYRKIGDIYIQVNKDGGARNCYRKAAEMGDEEAEERLAEYFGEFLNS